MISIIQPFKLISENTYIKREDLLGGLFNGIKHRKVQSILNHLKLSSYKKILLKGSWNSNFLVAIISNIIPLEIPFEIYINKKQKPHGKKGNSFFLSQMVDDKKILSIEDFPINTQEDWFVIEEGGNQLEGYLGLLTLTKEILDHELHQNIKFNNIWIDAGTCSGAICLLYMLNNYNHQGLVHIVSMYDDENTFLEKKQIIFNLLDEYFKTTTSLKTNHKFYRPSCGKSFGSTNSKIFQTIKDVSKKTGIFLDPIYSAKLYLTALENRQSGTELFIHSGGTLSICGFFDEFLKL